MTTTIRLIDTARAEALFASTLPTGSTPGQREATTMITTTVRRCSGVRGCAAEMAGAFGDSPEAAVRRMRWAREIALTLSGSDPSTTAHPGHVNPARAAVGAGRAQTRSSRSP
jgi:hypothetical protein